MQQKFFLTKIQKKNILLFLTKELIRNSGGDFYKLEKEIKEKENQRFSSFPRKTLEKENQEFSGFPRKAPEKENRATEILRGITRKHDNKIFLPAVPKKNPQKINLNAGAEETTENLKSEKYEQSLKPLPEKKERFKMPLGEAKLTVPETRLPEHFQYLRPIPTRESIDLGKLNPLIKDPMVRVVECSGPEGEITVDGTMGIKKTGIILSRDEISRVIDWFSRASKIPVHEGVFKVVLGNLIFMAIVSEIVGSRFTIKKMI